MMDYESPKFVIAWLAVHVDQTTAYYTGTTYKSSPGDTFGTTPTPNIRTSHKLSEAMVFDTVEEAMERQKTINSYHTHVKPVYGKELFLAKLSEYPNDV